MATNPMVDLTSRDWDSLCSDLRRYAQNRFPDWTDYTASNFGNTLLELAAYVGDMASFYQDNQACECFLPTVRRRKNMIALGKLVNYDMPGASAAQATVTLTVLNAPSLTNRIVFPTGYILRTNGASPLPFQFLSQCIILHGETSATATVENSIFREDSFVSTGLPNQRMTLSSRPYLEESAIVSAQNGQYGEVFSFLNTGATDRHFTVDIDDEDRATLVFGDGTVGAIPQGTMMVRYKIGGGLQGNVQANTIVNFSTSVRDDDGNPVTITVTNSLAASGGSDRQSVEKARIAAPLSLRALNRSVSADDIVNNVTYGVSGIERCLLLTSEDDVSIAQNEGLLYVLAEGGLAPTQAKLTEIRQFLLTEKPATITFRILPLGAILAPVNITVTAFPKSSYTPEQMEDDIIESLTEFFSPRNSNGEINDKIDFGKTVYRSNIEEACETPSSVDHLLSIDPISHDQGVGDYTLSLPQNFPTLGTVTVINGETGLPVGQIPSLTIGDVPLSSWNNGDSIPLACLALAVGGDNKSPHLTWSGAPAETVSYAIDMIDLTADDYVHWMLTNIPASTTTLGLGDDPALLPAGTIRHVNGNAESGYIGPFPPSGTQHTYRVTVYALDTGLSVPAASDRATVMTAIAGRIVAQGSIAGTVLL